MKKSPLILAVIAALGLGWLINSPHFEAIQGWLPGSGAQRPVESSNAATDTSPSGETIRIATFNIQVFGQKKLLKQRVMEVLADVIRRYDVVAIQKIRSRHQDVLPRFVAMINAGGRKYDFAISERIGRTHSKEQYAFIFDTQRIEIDRRYTVKLADPGDLLHREPLMGAFRVRGPPVEQAFTFTLVNIHTDPGEVGKELNALDDVFRAVQNDGRGEDDVILLGDLNTHAGQLGELGRLPSITAALPYDVKTNTRQSKQYDNILFHAGATREFTGRAGVLNLMHEYNLSLKTALEVSDHLPVWAEFSIHEGGHAGFVAAQAATRQ